MNAIAPRMTASKAERAVLRSRDFEVVSGRGIFILPTRQGVGFGGMLALMLVGSANYNNGLGYALVFLLASLGLVSLVHTYRNLAGLRLHVTAAPPVFAGSKAVFTLTFDNRGAQARSAVVVRLRPSAQPGAGLPFAPANRRLWSWSSVSWAKKRRTERERDVIVSADLEPNALQRLEVAVPTQARGWLEIEQVVLASRYPFGLFRAWAVPSLPVKAVVWPRPAGLELLPSSGASLAKEQVAGRHALGEDDFEGLREYAIGDSPGRIHWKSLARGQGVQVKQFSGGAAADLTLRWADTTGSTEARVAQLALWVLKADEAGHRYLLILDGEQLGPASGRAHRDQSLSALALFEPALVGGSPGHARLAG